MSDTNPTQIPATGEATGFIPAMVRKMADCTLDQKTVDDEFEANDILTNCRQYPKDEAPAAYKDFDAVLDLVKKAGLTSEVARLKARFVIKDSDMSLRGAAGSPSATGLVAGNRYRPGGAR